MKPKTKSVLFKFQKKKNITIATNVYKTIFYGALKVR